MPTPCNNVSVKPIKVSQLVRYKKTDGLMETFDRAKWKIKFYYR